MTEQSEILTASEVRSHDTDAGHWREALGIVGVLAPILLLTGTAKDAHEVAWHVWYLGVPGLVASISSAAVAIWLAWLVVLVLGLLRLRTPAIVLAWLASAGAVAAVDLIPDQQRTYGLGAGWVLLALLAAIATTVSAGPKDGLRDGLRDGLCATGLGRPVLLLITVAALVFSRGLGHNAATAYQVAWAVVVVATVLACRPTRPAGRHALLLLAVPALSAAGAVAVYANNGGLRRFFLDHGSVAMLAGYLLPLLLVVGGYLLGRRITGRAAARQGRPAE
ncbi:MAG TPA: hypothetical protein VHX38_35995 [Pseudonocardiaceae bacterium]|nr:hypothetical protein [Pseudonocardiaceae bacterium]